MGNLICESCKVKDCECVPYDVECDSCRSAYQQGIADAIEVCAKITSSLVGICKTSCPVDCNWGTDESCIESWKVYLEEQLKEQKND